MAFKQVMALWLVPDFSEVEAGRREPPRLNHSQVDFRALANFLDTLFPYGPPVTIQVPNDTIDQVTIHMRQMPGQGFPEAMRCADFGQILLAQAVKQKQVVVDVRTAWQKLHQLKDRDFAPPPVMVPFVVTATDFEDAMIWAASCRPSIGLPPFDVMKGATQEESHNGTLSNEALFSLEQIFGSPFMPMVVLDQIASSPVPAYARR